MTINSVRTIEFENDGSKLTVDATTWLPATPTLLIFCCGYRLLPKKVKRGGKDVPHGNLLYLDCTPNMFDPAATGGTEFHWEVANDDYVPGCNNCHLAIVELAEQPKVDWTTQVYECPPVPLGGVNLSPGGYFEGPAPAPQTLLSLSLWFNLSGLGGEQAFVIDPDGGDANSFNVSLNLFLQGDGTVVPQLFIRYDVGTDTSQVIIDFAPRLQGVWHHFICTVSGVDGTFSAFVDGAADGVYSTLNPPRFDAGPILMPYQAGVPFDVGWDGRTYTGDLAEFWFALGQDLRTGATISPDTLAAFLLPGGTPADLGANGEVPTGTAPDYFGHGGAGAFLQPNLGTAAPLGQFGGVIDAPTSPQIGQP